MKLDDLCETLGELVDIVTEGLDRTSRLVGDLRDLAAPDGGRQPDVNVARGLLTTLALVKHSFRDAGVALEIEVPPELPGIVVRAEASCSGQTGVEMEALTAAAVALLTVYDMAKGIDRAMVLEEVRLERKEGGRSGIWERSETPG